MPSSHPARLFLLPSLLAGACAAPMRPPATNAGPARSPAGVQVAVLRQGCAQTDEPDDYGWDLIEENVEIEVRNETPEAATVHRDRFRLLAPDGSELRTITWRAADPVVVASGQTEAFEIRFMTRGGLSCTKEMRLDPDGGITVGETPLALQSVAFVPSRAP